MPAVKLNSCASLFTRNAIACLQLINYLLINHRVCKPWRDAIADSVKMPFTQEDQNTDAWLRKPWRVAAKFAWLGSCGLLCHGTCYRRKSTELKITNTDWLKHCLLSELLQLNHKLIVEAGAPPTMTNHTWFTNEQHTEYSRSFGPLCIYR